MNSQSRNTPVLTWQKLPLRQIPDFFMTAHRLRTRFLTVFIQDSETALFKVIAPKKVFKLAHDRNRARRRLTEAVLRVQPSTPPAMALSVTSKEVLTLPFADLVKEVERVVNS